ncbi:MAG: LCP family protein [Eubacteriales bacterium]|nr:LCP family protein [Eubacteriales bacterium]
MDQEKNERLRPDEMEKASASQATDGDMTEQDAARCQATENTGESQPAQDSAAVSPQSDPPQAASNGGKKVRKPMKPAVKWTLISAAGLVVIAAVVVGLWLNNIFNRPETLFGVSAQAATATPAPTPTPRKTLGPDADAQEDAGHSLAEMEGMADTSTMKNIVNVLLIGVDYADERDTWQKDFNSDVMMILAMNFDENKVDMISVPRDTHAKIANTEGIYKLNSALTLGGGITDAGFMNVCDSVEWELGGVPVDYYIAVTMPVVKELTNAIGGIDFYVDVPITIQGRSMEVGYQHLDGQQVLDYCRARKNMEESGDLNRVNRQKKMLLAVFEKLQRSTQIFDVPELLLSMQGKVYTNLNLNQLAAMAVFGKKLDSANITMRTMGGTFCDMYNWVFVITNQQRRVDMIKEIYGVEVQQRVDYSYDYCRLEWACIQGDGYVEIIEKGLSNAAVKATDPDKLAQLSQAVNTFKAGSKKYAKKLDAAKTANKFNIAEADWIALEADKDAMYQLAVDVFGSAGYKVKWFVNENGEGSRRMTG